MPNVKRLKKVQELSSSHEGIKTSDQFKVNSQHCDFDSQKNQNLSPNFLVNGADIQPILTQKSTTKMDSFQVIAFSILLSSKITLF